MEEKSVAIKYSAGRTISSAWQSEDLYCPQCGARSVWRENDGGDYYVGEAYVCTSCSNYFHMPGCGNDKYIIDQIVEQLK